MTVEEKAKAYDEALEKTRIYRDNARIAEDYGAVARYENIFPELRESKDERMMRVIGLALTDVPEERFTSLGTTLKDCLAYIEKQKDHFRDDTKMIEQKPEDDKAFEEWIDDWWKHNKVNNPNSYDKGDEIQFDEKGFKNFCRGVRNMYANQESAEWSEEDENKIESIKGLITMGRFADTNTIRTIWKLLDSLRPQPHWKPSEEQMQMNAGQFIL